MKLIKTWWILLLLVGFTLPTVFQSFHIIDHHVQKEHASCKHDHSTQTPFQKNKPFSFDISEESCVICDFQLTDLKDNILVYNYSLIEHNFICEAGYNDLFAEYFKGLHKNLRAPPLT